MLRAWDIIHIALQYIIALQYKFNITWNLIDNRYYIANPKQLGSGVKTLTTSCSDQINGWTDAKSITFELGSYIETRKFIIISINHIHYWFV